MANKKEFTLSFIVGLVLLPLSAVAAVALVGGDEPAVEAAVVETTVTSTMAPVLAETPVAAGLSERDIWQACVPDATALIEKEVAGTISDLEIAALDSLRAICEKEGLPLSGPPAPEAIVRTVRVNAPTPAPAAASVTTTEAPSDEAISSDDDLDDDTYDDEYAEHEYEDEPEDDDDSEDVEDPYAGQSQYLAAHAEAEAAIDAAVAAGGKAEKIDEAREQLAEGEAKAANLDFWSALEKAYEAKEKADEAISDREDD